MGSIKKRITQLLRKHHYWREIGFDELSELYIGAMFRSLSLSIIGVFIPLYLLRLGYPVLDIVVLFAWYYVFLVPLAPVTAKLILLIGPKHTILVSHVFQIATLGLFMTLSLFHWPLLVLAAVWAIANSLYYIAYHVDFSKIKHTEHGGKELGLASILENIGYAAGPVVGGILATFFGAQFAFLVATVILFIGIVPLMSTAEQVTLHRPLNFRLFTLRRMFRDSFVFSWLCVENLVSTFFWPLYISLFLVTGLAYAELGAISTAGFLASLIMARLIGQLTDRHKGRQLLQGSVLGMSATFLVRPFLQSIGIAGFVNLIYQSATMGMNLPFYKGLYDHADEYGEHRVEYFTILEVVNAFLRALVCWAAVLLLGHYNTQLVLMLTFVLAAIACCAGIAERFEALD
ncbi:MFS transporter [Candidatus Microgenomates bacterium]|nr:MFS transporter [Candidatus Microgenomates bacterium]